MAPHSSTLAWKIPWADVLLGQISVTAQFYLENKGKYILEV